MTPLLTTAQVAATYGVAPSTVRGWVQRGWLKPDGRLGPRGSYLFKPETLEAFFTHCMSGRVRGTLDGVSTPVGAAGVVEGVFSHGDIKIVHPGTSGHLSKQQQRQEVANQGNGQVVCRSALLTVVSRCYFYFD